MIPWATRFAVLFSLFIDLPIFKLLSTWMIRKTHLFLVECYFEMNGKFKNDLQKYWVSNKQKLAKEMMENYLTEVDEFYDFMKEQHKEVLDQFSNHNNRFTMV